MSVESLAGTIDSETANPLDASRRQSAHDELKESRDALFTEFSSGAVKENFLEEYSEIIDN